MINDLGLVASTIGGGAQDNAVGDRHNVAARGEKRKQFGIGCMVGARRERRRTKIGEEAVRCLLLRSGERHGVPWQTHGCTRLGDSPSALQQSSN